MEEESKSLKDMIDLFLRDSAKTIRTVKRGEKNLDTKELEEVAQRIWDLHYFAKQLIEVRPTESLYYNARIIKEIVEEKLKEVDTSLLGAADALKKESNDKPIRIAIEKLASEDRARTVLFENLEEISQELAA